MKVTLVPDCESIDHRKVSVSNPPPSGSEELAPTSSTGVNGPVASIAPGAASVILATGGFRWSVKYTETDRGPLMDTVHVAPRIESHPLQCENWKPGLA